SSCARSWASSSFSALSALVTISSRRRSCDTNRWNRGYGMALPVSEASTSARRSASCSLGVSAIGVLLLIGAARWRGHGLHDRRRWARSWRDARDEARGVGRIHAELHQQDLAHGALHLAVREALDNRDGLADLRAVEPL